MQQEPQQRFTTTELALAEKIGTFLLPMMRQVAENVAKPRTDATTKFCREFSELQRARQYIPDTASPMARVDLESRLLELAAKFVATHAKE